jgi:hypothetical protein
MTSFLQDTFLVDRHTTLEVSSLSLSLSLARARARRCATLESDTQKFTPPPPPPKNLSLSLPPPLSHAFPKAYIKEHPEVYDARPPPDLETRFSG